MTGRVDFKPAEWAPDTFDMDSLALRVVPNPNGMYPLSKYISLLGTPGLTAFVGFEGLVEAKEVRHALWTFYVYLPDLPLLGQYNFRILGCFGCWKVNVIFLEPH